MKVIITGGTGVIGKRLVPKLIGLGHTVGVTTRSEKKSEEVKSMGATSLIVDLFDPKQVKKAIEGYEAVIHLATSIPTKVKTKPSDWELNNKLRTEVTDNLLNASLENNVKLYIQESFVGIYGHRNSTILDESIPILNPVPTAVNIGDGYKEIYSSLVEMENKVNEANKKGLPTIILRFGMFYAHDASMIPDMASGKFPIVGSGDNFMSILNIDDASESIITALHNFDGNTGKTFNIVENDVPEMKELLNFSANYIGKKKASKVPKFLVRLLFGKFATNFMTTSARMSNSAAKELLGWKPKYQSFRQGIAAEIDMYNKMK